MIPTKHTRFHSWFMSQYTKIGLRRNFERIIIHGGFVEEGKPLLIIGNHFSWWDGFFIYYLNDHYFHRRFHVMMLEDQLRKNMILNKVGAFSVEKNSRSIVESLKYARGILKDGPQNLLLYYPQGEIQSQYTAPLVFQKGLEKVVGGLEKEVDIWMVANLVDYFSHKKPELHMYLQRFDMPAPFNIKELEVSYNSFMKQSKLNQEPGL